MYDLYVRHEYTNIKVFFWVSEIIVSEKYKKILPFKFKNIMKKKFLTTSNR